MAYFAFFVKSIYYQRLKQDLLHEKQEQIKIERSGLKQPKQAPLWFRIRNCCHLPTFLKKGSFLAFFSQSLFWFLIGITLTYLIFIFVFGHINPNLLSFATLFTIKLCFMLSFGLAFNNSFRCLVLLVLPEFFSKRGRQLLLLYCFALIFLGPTRNVLDNIRVLSDSLDCSQLQLKEVVQDFVNMAKQPLVSMKRAIQKLVHNLRIGCRKLKEIFITIKNTVSKVLIVIKNGFSFLGTVTKICNKKIGTPFSRCINMFEVVVKECQSGYGPWLRWMCSVTKLVNSVCYLVKFIDYLCEFVSFVDGAIVGVISRKLKTFVHNVNTMFYARIELTQAFKFETKQSQKYSTAFNTVLDELQKKSAYLQKVFNYFSLIGYLFILFLVIKAIKYRHKFLTIDRFDNRFITKEFIEVDVKRFEMNKDTVLPLNVREKKKYTSLFSMSLNRAEWMKILKNSVWITIVTIEAVIYVTMDYSLFWILDKIRFYGKNVSDVPAEPETVDVTIDGEGILADLYRTIAKAFNPADNLEMKETSIKSCLPTPTKPNYGLYEEIFIIITLCWLLVIVEPYGLRMRYFVLAKNYPDRARERAIWLYNHILRSRSGFLKMARRQLRRNFSTGKSSEMPSIFEIIKHKLENIWICRKCFRFKKIESCILCGETKRDGDDVGLIRCTTPKCKGVYCLQCFVDLKKKCTVCKDPIDYGDMSDASEELDSSDEKYSDHDDVVIEIEEKESKSKPKPKTSKIKGIISNWKQKIRKKSNQFEKFENIDLDDLIQKSNKKLHCLRESIRDSIIDNNDIDLGANEEWIELQPKEREDEEYSNVILTLSDKEYVSDGTQTEPSDFPLSDASDSRPLIRKRTNINVNGKKKRKFFDFKISRRKQLEAFRKRRISTSNSSSDNVESDHN